MEGLALGCLVDAHVRVVGAQSQVAHVAQQVPLGVLRAGRAEVRAVVARICGGEPDSLPVRALAFSLFHQAFYFRLAEPVLLQHLAQQSLSGQVQAQLLQTLAQGLRAQLQAAAGRVATA